MVVPCAWRRFQGRSGMVMAARMMVDWPVGHGDRLAAGGPAGRPKMLYYNVFWNGKGVIP